MTSPSSHAAVNPIEEVGSPLGGSARFHLGMTQHSTESLSRAPPVMLHLSTIYGRSTVNLKTSFGLLFRKWRMMHWLSADCGSRGNSSEQSSREHNSPCQHPGIARGFFAFTLKWYSCPGPRERLVSSTRTWRDGGQDVRFSCQTYGPLSSSCACNFDMCQISGYCIVWSACGYSAGD